MTRDTFKPIRYGNIELRRQRSSIGNVESDQIVCYYPNSYYGREREFIWDKDGEWAHPRNDPDHYSVHKNCFKSKELCYIRSVGTRAFDLKDEDAGNLQSILADLKADEESEDQ